MKMVGIVLDESKIERLDKLTNERAISSMPVAGCYRAIDFVISNMTNSGIQKIGVITQFCSSSILNHLSTPKIWNLGEKKGGLFVFTPSMVKGNLMWHRGTADSIYQNIDFLKKSQEPYVLISPGNIINKIDYREMLKYHEEKEADITILSQKVEDKEELSRLGIMEVDESCRVIEFEEKPLEPQSNIASLGVYILKRTLLINLLETVIKEGRFDFVTDIIMRYRRKLKMYIYDYKGYWSNIGSINKYFETNMDFLDSKIRKDMLLTRPYISTRAKDDPPAKFNNGVKVVNSLVGGGNILNGEVSNSVLFNKVYTGTNSYVNHSIIMNDSYVGNNCIIEYAIIDKGVIISDGKEIRGTKDNIVIVSKGDVI